MSRALIFSRHISTHMTDILYRGRLHALIVGVVRHYVTEIDEIYLLSSPFRPAKARPCSAVVIEEHNDEIKNVERVLGNYYASRAHRVSILRP